MRILGKNSAADAYRVAIDLGDAEVVALVSDALLSSQYGVDHKVSHDQAYERIAAQQHDLSDAIISLNKGAAPGAPFQHITLE